MLTNHFCCKSVPFVYVLRPLYSSRDSISLSSDILPLNMLYFKSVAILMHDIKYNLAPQNILRLFNTTDHASTRL